MALTELRDMHLRKKPGTVKTKKIEKGNFYRHLIQDETYTDNKFVKCRFEDTVFERVKFIDCCFESCIFDGTKMVDCEFDNCTFADIKFVAVHVKGSSRFAYSMFLHTDIRVEALNQTIVHCTFVSSTLSNLALGCVLHKNTFVDCELCGVRDGHMNSELKSDGTNIIRHCSSNRFDDSRIRSARF